MITLHAPWLLMAIVTPLGAAALSTRLLRRVRVGPFLTVTTILTLLASLAASLDYLGLEAELARDPALVALGLREFGVDALNDVLLPFVAGLFAIVAFAKIGAGSRPEEARLTLLMEGILLALFSAQTPAWIAALFAASILPEVFGGRLRARGQRPFQVYNAAGVLLITVGAFGLGSESVPDTIVVLALLGGTMIRKGIFPLHSWVLDLYERATLPRAVLLTAPQVGALLAARLFIPNAPAWALAALGGASLFTAVYAAGLAAVQRDAKRGLGAIFTSQSALVLVGLCSKSAVGVTGGLCLWVSSGLATAGFGTTFMALAARRGPLHLGPDQGGFERTPLLAASFLLLGLASVGFPGTLGFVGQEALYEASTIDFPRVGIAVALATALNGITVLRAFFALFCGAPTSRSKTHRLGLHEVAACMLLLLALIGVGVAPSSFLASRQTAVELLQRSSAERPSVPPGSGRHDAPRPARPPEGPSRDRD